MIRYRAQIERRLTDDVPNTTFSVLSALAFLQKACRYVTQNAGRRGMKITDRKSVRHAVFYAYGDYCSRAKQRPAHLPMAFVDAAISEWLRQIKGPAKRRNNTDLPEWDEYARFFTGNAPFLQHRGMLDDDGGGITFTVNGETHPLRWFDHQRGAWRMYVINGELEQIPAPYRPVAVMPDDRSVRFGVSDLDQLHITLDVPHRHTVSVVPTTEGVITT